MLTGEGYWWIKRSDFLQMRDFQKTKTYHKYSSYSTSMSTASVSRLGCSSPIERNSVSIRHPTAPLFELITYPWFSGIKFIADGNIIFTIYRRWMFSIINGRLWIIGRNRAWRSKTFVIVQIHFHFSNNWFDPNGIVAAWLMKTGGKIEV